MKQCVVFSAAFLSSLLCWSLLSSENPPYREYHLIIPKYFGSTLREEWHDPQSRLYNQLQDIAIKMLEVVSDERLSVQQRVSALSVVQEFSADITSERLIDLIELEDDRGFFFGDPSLGRHPAVTVLKEYGSVVSETICSALENESSPRRRELLCEVLRGVIGVEQAVKQLEKFITDNNKTPEQKDHLQLAIDEVERQANAAHKR